MTPNDRPARVLIPSPRTFIALIGPGVLILGLLAGFALLPRPEAEGQEAKDGDSAPAPCGRWHRGGGDSQPIDLDAVRRSYRELASKLDSSLAKVQAEAPKLLDRPHRTGLAKCVRPAVRIEKLAGGGDGRLAQQRFYFGALGDPERFRLPAPIESDPGALVFLLECARLRDVGDLSRRLGRPVHLATEVFAKALGVGCAGSRVQVSEKGDEVEIHEGE